jgi:adenylosuccinate synthase|nr:MAG TPA: adenylosuccinate synthetase [Caudoviricetes sp.]
MNTTMNTTKKATIVVDAQFGSTGKGLIAGYLAERDQPDVVMTAWSANAGHTYIDANGRKFVHCMLANGIVSPALTHVLIGPGSQISAHVLAKEIAECRDILKGKTLLIHQNAAIITQAHVDEEAGPMTKIGSTKKGCGAAMIAKIRRNPDDQNTAGAMKESILDLIYDTLVDTNIDDDAVYEGESPYDIDIRVVGNDEYMEVVYAARRIQVEGAQGFSLGINNGFYPYVTSRECTPAQVCVDVNLPLAFVDKVVATMRTYPIRVANRYNEAGEQIGWSGPCYPDQKELDWKADLGMEAELTTVTKLPRRIFTFSYDQTKAALSVIRPDEVFLNFCNYMEPDEVAEVVGAIEGAASDLNIPGRMPLTAYYGYGPTVTDIYTEMQVQEPEFGGNISE